MKVFKELNDEVAELLTTGAVGIIPTDTIYGIVALLNNKPAIERIYAVKKRPENKRVGTTLIAAPNQISSLVKSDLLKLASNHWPGTSVELPVNDEMFYAHRGNNTLAFRIPKTKALISLVKKTGPLATTSANFSSELPVNTAEEAIERFGDLVDFYVDGGDLSANKPSRIIKILNNGSLEIIRE
jgi:L-threonylcarbamoyladenylate synthase